VKQKLHLVGYLLTQDYPYL